MNFSDLKGTDMVQEITDKRQKKKICADILYALPEWFEAEKSIRSYAKGCMDKAMWAYIDGDDIKGFISLNETSRYTAEIYVMGVKKEYHRQGIGKKLFSEFEKFASGKYDYLQVKTVAEGYYNDYDMTNAFYRSVGFRELEVIKEVWNEDNPCQIYVKFIGN